MVIVLIQYPYYSEIYDTKDSTYWFDFSDPSSMFENLGIFVFSSNITTTYHAVKECMHNPTNKRLVIMSITTVATVYFPYILIGIFGYLSLGHETQNVPLFPNRIPLPGSDDIAMDLGKVGLICTITTAYLMRIIVIKKQFFDYFQLKISDKTNIIFTLSILFIPSLIGWFFPFVTQWFGLIGAFSMTGLIVVWPSIIGVVEYRKAEYNPLLVPLIAIWGFIFTLLGLTATYFTAMSFVH